MKLNSKDMEDLEGVIYWASAARTDLQGISPQARLCPPEELIAHALEMIEKIDGCAERILLGKNRTPQTAQGK